MSAALGRRLRPLRLLLADLYPREQDLKRVLWDRGIGPQEVSGGAPAINLWQEALDLIIRRGVLRALLDAASEEFPEHAEALAGLLADVEPHLPGSRTPERLEQLATEAEAATSEVLDWPSTLPSGAAIARPESQTIQQYVSDPEIAVIVVLGEAGCGKSALLATTGHDLRKAGIKVLGVRLDRLGKDVNTDEQLQRYFGLSEPLVDTVEALASQGPVTVIIDQLDALCDLMTERAGRLALMLDTIERLAGIENVHVVLASRPFEYQHDVRLRRVRAVEVTLALPAWNEVEPHIVALDIDPKLLPTDLREELRKPQALRTFLDLVGQGHDWRQLTTYHAMREFLWDSHVKRAHDGARRRQVLFDLAQWMAREEVLTRPLAQIDDWHSEIGVLESAGWLQKVGLAASAGVTFRHQSLFDFAYARSVVASGGSLLDHVLQHQGLFIRRRVWSVLAYLREASRGQYLREFGRLWNAPGLRRHLKRLLIDFLGQTANPEPQEAAWLREALEDPAWSMQSWIAAGRGRDWYGLLRARELPRAMSDPGLAGYCTSVLQQAAPTQLDGVLDLLAEHWTGDRDGFARCSSVLAASSSWSDRAFDLAERIAGELSVGQPYLIETLGHAALPQAPERACTLVAAALKAEVDRLLQQLLDTPDPDPPADEADVNAGFRWWRAKETRWEPIRRLFEGSSHWLHVSEVAEVAPHAFVHAVWPVMKLALEAIAHPMWIFPSFRRELDLLEGLEGADSTLQLLRTAVVAMARTDADSFVSFLRREGECDMVTLHMLMLEGLSQVVASRPDVLLEYFHHDRRRLYVGPSIAPAAATLECLVRVSSQLEARVQQEMADIFMHWSPLEQLPPKWDAERRRRHMGFVREHRLNLLLCLDAQKLSSSTRARIEEEQRALPYVQRFSKPRPRTPSLQPVKSRMQAAHMEKAADKEILGFFAERTSAITWDRRRSLLEGGSTEAARELAALTEKDPARGFRIAAQLSPQSQQAAVGMVINAAAKVGFDASTIFEFIEVCERRGFDSGQYRTDVAHAVETIARREGRVGLPDSMCRILRSWLTDAGAEGRDADCHAKGENRIGRILFQNGMGDPLPAGNCYVLGALSMGLLNRQNPDYETWVTILEEHAKREEQARMWQALAYSVLTYVGNADRSRAAVLLAAIFERFPELLDVRQGLHLVDRHMDWLPEELTRGWLESLRGRGTPWHAQAFGELMVLRAYRRPNDAWSRAEIERLINASDATDEAIVASRHGIAFMCALAVREEILLGVADSWLLRLAETKQRAISAALLEAFPYGDPVPYSTRMDALLAVLEVHPFHLRHDGIGGLLHAMQAYVKQAPDRVVRLSNAIIDMFGHDLADVRLHAAAHASELVDLALTLQDIPGQLLAGLDLFERLQDLNLGEVEAVLNEREAQPGVQAAPRRRPRRPPRPRAR